VCYDGAVFLWKSLPFNLLNYVTYSFVLNKMRIFHLPYDCINLHGFENIKRGVGTLPVVREQGTVTPRSTNHFYCAPWEGNYLQVEITDLRT
jgi:hypothetical protein